ncbi:MAG: peptidylprolyl isomerase [Planctomycetota bacterium]
MWRRIRAWRARKSKSATRKTRRLNAESLETRTMLTAIPLGTGAFVSQTPTSTSSTGEIAAGQVVFGTNGETLTVSHGAPSASARTGSSEEIFVHRFDSDGNQIEDAILANQITRGDQMNPTIAAANDGSFLVVWDGRGEGDRQGIFARRFDADGTPLGDQFRVNTTTGGDQVMPDVAMALDGTAVVTWHGVGTGDTFGVFSQRIGSDDALLGDETRVNLVTENAQGYASVAMDNDGNYVVAWSSKDQDGDDWGIFAQRFNADGSRNLDVIAVNTTTEGSQHYADVDMTASGSYAIVWSSFEQDGDSWGLFGALFDAQPESFLELIEEDDTLAEALPELIEIASAEGEEFQINADGAGHQLNASVAVVDGFFSLPIALDSSGEFAAQTAMVVAWSNGVADGSGWEVNAQTYDQLGVPNSDAVVVNQQDNGSDSGHQRNPSVAANRFGESVILFEGESLGRGNRVQQQRFGLDGIPPDRPDFPDLSENVRPSISAIDAPDEIRVGETLEVVFRARDLNFDPFTSVDEALTFVIEENPDTPIDAELVNVVSNSSRNEATLRWTPTAADRGNRYSFRVIVTDSGDPPLSDAAQFLVDVVNSPPELDLNGNSAGDNQLITVGDGVSEVDLLDTNLILTDVDQTEMSSATVSLRSFPDLTDESLSVITEGTNITATYTPSLGRLELTGVDSIENYRSVLSTLSYSNTGSVSGSQRVIEVTVNDGTDNSNEALITLRFGDNTAPELPAFDAITVVAGSPLHIALNGFDADGDDLTYSVTSSDLGLLTPTVLEGNQSWRVQIEGTGSNSDIQGDMIFELFEQRAPRATDRFIELTNDNFFDDIVFHRVINNFVIQGGDPTATGTGGSTLGDFDDQYHVDLQHNRTGILSMAKSLDDTNDSQFFVTEGPTRTLDFQHTVFGVLVEGEEIRQAISNVATGAGDRPIDDVVIADAEIFVDNQNGVLMLSAPEGTSGMFTVEVTVSDGNGGTTVRNIAVEVVPDTFNAQPFLNDIPTITTSVDTPASFQLSAQDVEGDEVFFFDEARLGSVGQPVFAPSHPDLDYSVDLNSGLLTITPTNGLTGNHQITVAVASSPTPGSNIDFQVIDVVIN